MSLTGSNSTRQALKKQLLDLLKKSTGSLIIASATLAPPAAKAAVNPHPDQAVSARVEKIQDQIGQPKTDPDGLKTMKDWRNWRNWHNWRKWHNHPVWSNWSNWNNWHNWGNQNWHNWADWFNHRRN